MEECLLKEGVGLDLGRWGRTLEQMAWNRSASQAEGIANKACSWENSQHALMQQENNFDWWAPGSSGICLSSLGRPSR